MAKSFGNLNNKLFLIDFFFVKWKYLFYQIRSEIDATTAKREQVNRKSSEEYFQVNLLFTREKQFKSEQLFLEAGDYSYDFEFKLPHNIPGSFEHNLARIRYTITGTIEIPRYLKLYNICEVTLWKISLKLLKWIGLMISKQRK